MSKKATFTINKVGGVRQFTPYNGIAQGYAKGLTGTLKGTLLANDIATLEANGRACYAYQDATSWDMTRIV